MKYIPHKYQEAVIEHILKIKVLVSIWGWVLERHLRLYQLSFKQCLMSCQ